MAGLFGASWFYFWEDPDLKFYWPFMLPPLEVMLLPMAYIAFFLMMNSRAILGEEKSTGGRMVAWNLLMAVAVLGALAAAGTAINDKIQSDDKVSGAVVLTLLIGYVVAIVAGFLHKYCSAEDPESNSAMICWEGEGSCRAASERGFRLGGSLALPLGAMVDVKQRLLSLPARPELKKRSDQ